MRTVNKVIIIGNVTRDPMIKSTEGGKKIALFTTATNRYFKTSDGQEKSEAEFHNCVAWGWLAERIEKFLTKGKLIYVEGRLKTRIIEKDGGEKSYKTEVVATNLIFLNKKWDIDESVVDEGPADEIEVESSLSIDDDDKF